MLFKKVGTTKLMYMSSKCILKMFQYDWNSRGAKTNFDTLNDQSVHWLLIWFRLNTGNAKVFGKTHVVLGKLEKDFRCSTISFV